MAFRWRLSIIRGAVVCQRMQVAGQQICFIFYRPVINSSILPSPVTCHTAASGWRPVIDIAEQPYEGIFFVHNRNGRNIPWVKVVSWHTLHIFRLCDSSWLCAICSQQVGCHGSPSFSILCHSDTVIIWYFCPFLDVIRPHCSRSPPSSSTIYPSFHQQSLYPISSYYMSKILTFPFLIVFNNDLLVFISCKTSPLVLCSFNDILNILLHRHISKASKLFS